MQTTNQSATVSNSASLLPAPALTPQNSKLAISSSLGTADLLTESQEVEFQACEAVITRGWRYFVEVGLALAKIRDHQLYKNEFDSFEAYCRARWECEHSKAYCLISAAQVCQSLEALPDIPKPDRESQVRPLLGLAPETAQLAWQFAVASSRDGRVPARLVKRAVKQLQATGAVELDPVPSRQQRYEQRRSIREAFEELLTLLVGQADRETLIGKVQALQRRIEPLLGGKKSQA